MVANIENAVQAASTTMSATQLSDIIQQVPQVLGHMSRKSRRALLSTSRQFRSQMHQTATSMKVQSVQDIPLLVSQQWSHMKVVHLRGLHDLDARCLTELAMADWPLLQTLSLRNSSIEQSADQSAELSPLLLAKWPLLEAIDFNNHCLQLASWKILAEAHWPWLRRLSLRNNDADAAKLQWLVTGNWPMLEELDLSFNSMNEQCMETLSKGNWPQLKKLKLKFCTLPVDASAYLALGKWPCLESLDFSGNGYLPAQVLIGLTEAHWPLFKDLDLASTLVKLSVLPYLAEAWPNLQSLHLDNYKVSAKSMNLLVMCEWLHLRKLCLSSSKLDAAAIRRLSLGNWPNLDSLDLGRNSLLASDIEALVKGKWYKLQTLYLYENCLDAAAMVHLANGSWPLLRSLSLAWNRLDVEALQNLMKGAWFELETLDLCDNMTGSDRIYGWGTGLTGPCCDAAIAVLRGDSDVVLQEGVNWLSPAKQLGNGQWPKLRFLNLSNIRCSDSSHGSLSRDMKCYLPDDE